jgi:hypothetical protein
MSFEEFVAQARAGMNEGGIADIGFSRVQPSKDGSRPGYKWSPGVAAEERRSKDLGSMRGGVGRETNREAAIRKAATTTTPKVRNVHETGAVTQTGGPTYYDRGEIDEDAADTDVKVKKLIPTDTKTTTSAIDKAKELILGPTQYIVNKIGKASMVPFLKYRKNAHLKTLGTDDPNVYEEDETYKAIVNALSLAEKGELSNKDFQDFMPGGIHGKELLDFGPDQGGDGPGITSQYPYPYPYPINTAMAPAVVPPVVPPVQTANPFLPGSNLPFSTYGTAAHGAQFGVDPRMFAADGGRIGYADAGSVKNVDQVREAILKGIRDGIFTFNDLTQYDETGVLPKEEDSISSRYNRAINLIKPFEGKEIREPFYPDRFENLKPELMAQGGRIGYAGGGITNLRQGYFLGKLVKKIGRGIKKVAKSPVGKLALIGGLGFGIPGTGFKGLMGGGTKGKLMDMIFGTMKYGHPTEAGVRAGGLLGFAKKNPFASIAALSSLPLLFGESQEEEEGINYADLPNIFDKYSPNQLRKMALAGELPQDEFPFQQYYAADGGRIGYDDGGSASDRYEVKVKELMDKGLSRELAEALVLSELSPDAYSILDKKDGGRIGYDMGGIANTRAAALNQLYGINDDEDKKFSQGGSAGLPPITSGVEGQNLQSFSDERNESYDG